MWPDLRFFRRSEFKNPDLIEQDALVFLDAVRARYARPLVVTDDARRPGDCPRGCAKTSWHYKGRAFDLRWPPSSAAVYDLVKAAILIEHATGVPIEIELVYSETDKHAHLALKPAGEGHDSTFIVRAE